MSDEKLNALKVIVTDALAALAAQNRETYIVPGLGEEYDDAENPERRRAPTREANLISSIDRTQDVEGVVMHRPTLDIDMDCSLFRSSTPGHWHLLIEKPMPYRDYLKLLKVLVEVGIVEAGFANSAIRRGATFVRKPGITKKASSEAPADGEPTKKADLLPEFYDIEKWGDPLQREI